ncbi:uncharacterized protein BX664DRAFT_320490 [Halteromyces radiatus]|uniref:uncharacterized protein n=1 Tax=Halteromyces radiatus TaxID=101107 RepID=UPI0022201652|nr:uncharacterized protein BX664DRAFT_320490 [Halteromyces radiatus]KAI8099137.1 hypothetical protein BX664DRAFT_320490 [Halteromyces radiatus]
MVAIEVPSTANKQQKEKKTTFKKTNVSKSKAYNKIKKQDNQTRTTGMALLQSLTAKKAAQDALIKGAKAAVHVSFDDDGEVEETNDNKRKSQDDDDNDEKKNNGKKPKQIKEKKKKGTLHLQGPSDKKRQESLTYLKTFVNDRSQWKFSKIQQSWLLQHIYDSEAIPNEDFDRLVLYLKDLMGMSREKTLKEAQDICQDTKASTQPVTSTTATYPGYDDDDDFDAEKLLASASYAAPVTEEVNQPQQTDSTNLVDNVKLERAKIVLRTLM